MKTVYAGIAALLLAAIGWTASASAQGLPPGSYMSSCNNAGVRGDRLVATCRARDGREVRSALPEFRRCAGDIGNNNGVLQCTLPNGAQMRAEVVGEPGYRPGPPPYAPAPPPGPGPGYWERCRELRARADELRFRRDQAWNPVERERIEYRLREVHQEFWNLGCRY